MSLQKKVGAEQVADVKERFAVEQFDPPLDEGTGAFVDTAAVMQQLDLVITSDTAIAHLAGTLGVKVWWRCRPLRLALAARGFAVVSDHAAVPPAAGGRLGGGVCRDFAGDCERVRITAPDIRLWIHCADIARRRVAGAGAEQSAAAPAAEPRVQNG